MKPSLLTALIALVGAVPGQAQERSPAPNDVECIVRAALDYMEGALTADPERVARGTHPELTKVTVSTMPNGRQALSHNGQSMLVEVVRGFGTSVADVDKTVEVTVFDAGSDLAVARATSARWYDFLQLARIDGRWRIVNVLWARNDTGPAAPDQRMADSAAVTRTALDYIEGAYAGDAARMERALHPELTKVLLTRHPETGRPLLYRIGASNLVEGTRAGLGNLPEAERGIAIEIYDISRDMAALKVTSAKYIDHLQIARVNGEWKIVNVLWVPNPEAAPQGG
ncbi:MAG: nuclear transport factor 2 family protein [Gemmatimonadales bacterium]|nr:nuclear transport factor 2 family protein [Gemmatimonadales bacterium]